MGDAVGDIVGKVLDLLFGVAIREISYICNCSENVQNLKEEVEGLKGMKEMFEVKINDADRKAEVPTPYLKTWMTNANYKISEAEKFIAEEDQSIKTCCNLHFCVNLGTLYHYGKMATKLSRSLLKQKEDAQSFEIDIFDPLPTPGFVDKYQKKKLENIDIQKATVKKIVEAIEDDKIQIVGITGLGGVGKTTVASEVAEEMKHKFDHIEFIPVSRNVEIKSIKEKVDIAARKAFNKDKVLIILDDVWEGLKLDEVGIPCGSNYKDCKILITSRRVDVCTAMNAEMIIEVNILQEKEAWALFEHVVGIYEWDNKLKKVASEIVKQCGGLPLFVKAIGRALKGKAIGRWEEALHRLQAPIDGDPHDNKKELQDLMISYDYLDNKVEKACFLLCSMFPEDGNIGLKRLTHYALALGILNNPDSIQDAKLKVQGVVESLKSAFLLQPVEKFNFYRVSQEGEEEHFKMHDLIRDMALSVATKSDGDAKFWVRSGRGLNDWQPKPHFESYKKISLMGNTICNLPDHKLIFPHLDTLLIQDNGLLSVPDEFFRDMKKLEVLDMSRNEFSSLPRSLKHLRRNLRTLYLSENSCLCDISILGEIACLEILMLRGTGITCIPTEIGKLTNLRLLDVDYCPYLSCITPGVISNLVWLEEFYIGIAECDCSFVRELRKLQSPKILHLKVPELRYFPEDFRFESLIEFHIKDNVVWIRQTHDCKRILELSQHSFPLTPALMKLIQESEMLKLDGIQDFDNCLGCIYKAGFKKLRYIDFGNSANIRSLENKSDLDKLGRISKRVNDDKLFSQVEEIRLSNLGSLEHIWKSPHEYISFCNLEKIYITNCPSLLELFPLSVAQGLVKLKELYISKCESLVVVISSTGDEQTTGINEINPVDDTSIMFPNLDNIHLSKLPKLESFYSIWLFYYHISFFELCECARLW